MDTLELRVRSRLLESRWPKFPVIEIQVYDPHGIAIQSASLLGLYKSLVRCCAFIAQVVLSLYASKMKHNAFLYVEIRVSTCNVEYTLFSS